MIRTDYNKMDSAVKVHTNCNTTVYQNKLFTLTTNHLLYFKPIKSGGRILEVLFLPGHD